MSYGFSFFCLLTVFSVGVYYYSELEYSSLLVLGRISTILHNCLSFYFIQLGPTTNIKLLVFYLFKQIAYLLVERAKLNEELTAARTKPASDREKELTAQLIKVRKLGLQRID